MEYKKLLGHSKTRWLTLLPALERIRNLFPALKEYFLSEKKCPTILENFSKDPYSEFWLMFAITQASLFHKCIMRLESQDISMRETALILKEFKFKIIQRKEECYLPVNINKILLELEKNNAPEINIKIIIGEFYQFMGGSIPRC